MTYSSFTPPTRTRQNCFELSVSAVRTQLATRQDSFVLSGPSFDEFCLVSTTQFPISTFSVILNIFETEQVQIENWVKTRQNSSKPGQEKTKLSCLVANCVHTADTDNSRQFCLVRVGGVNELSQAAR